MCIRSVGQIVFDASILPGAHTVIHFQKQMYGHSCKHTLYLFVVLPVFHLPEDQHAQSNGTGLVGSASLNVSDNNKLQ